MGEWSNGLFGCFANCGVCIITYLVPCVTAGQTAEKVGESCCLYGCLSILGPIGIYTRASIRGKVRESKGIEGSFMMDCLLHWFCALCALVQEANIGLQILIVFCTTLRSIVDRIQWELGGAQAQSMARE